MNNTTDTKQNTKKHRFNIVDFVLVTAVIACVIGIAIRYNLNLSMLRGGDKATVTVKIEGLLTEYTSALQEGDAFFYQTTGNPLGTLLSVEASPAKTRFVAHDGTMTTVNYEDRVDIICTLEVEGYNSANGFMIDGSTYIGSGSNILVRSQHLETQMFVLNVEAAE